MANWVGIDGCRAGWVLSILDSDGDFLPVQVCSTLAEAVDTGDLVLVDIPIGLGTERRTCDAAAKAVLGPRRSSIFLVPVRAAIHAPSYREACAINQAAVGWKLSMQTWNIAPKIAEADLLMRDNPAMQLRVRESHPEVCFTALNGWQPMQHKKKTPAGAAERLELLSRLSGNAEAAYRKNLDRYRRSQVAADDILDAMVLAVSARDAIASGTPTLPAMPLRDEYGLRMEIVIPIIPAPGGDQP